MKCGILSCALLVAGAVVAPAHAGVWSADNTADVGNLIATASITDGTGSLDKIQGGLVASFSGAGPSWDQDVYCIHITDGTAFSALAYPSPGRPGGGAGGDFNLVLLDLQGHGIAFNDNANGLPFPALTNLFTANLPAGDYVLGISRNVTSGTAANTRFNRPLSAAGLMFPGQTNNTNAGDPTAALRDGEYSAMSSVFAGWETTPFSFPFNDYYDIDLTGATFCVPAPAGLGLLGLGAVASLRRRR